MIVKYVEIGVEWSEETGHRTARESIPQDPSKIEMLHVQERGVQEPRRKKSLVRGCSG
jgi:hypothetical protein